MCCWIERKCHPADRYWRRQNHNPWQCIWGRSISWSMPGAKNKLSGFPQKSMLSSWGWGSIVVLNATTIAFFAHVWFHLYWIRVFSCQFKVWILIWNVTLVPSKYEPICSRTRMSILYFSCPVSQIQITEK